MNLVCMLWDRRFMLADSVLLGLLQETAEERSLRTRVFVQGAFHWSVSIIGYCVFFVIGCVAIPHIFAPVKVRYHIKSVLSVCLSLHSLIVAGRFCYAIAVSLVCCGLRGVFCAHLVVAHHCPVSCTSLH